MSDNIIPIGAHSAEDKPAVTTKHFPGVLDALDDALDTVAAIGLAIAGNAELHGDKFSRDHNALCRLISLHRDELSGSSRPSSSARIRQGAP